MDRTHQTTLSIIIPCFNEENTLEQCLENVLNIRDEKLSLEIIIVDDCSTDASFQIAQRLSEKFKEIRVLQHQRNRGKGAALQTGFQHAKGDSESINDKIGHHLQWTVEEDGTGYAKWLTDFDHKSTTQVLPTFEKAGKMVNDLTNAISDSYNKHIQG